MALTEKTRPYETLIRHNPDGSIGAHHHTITEILRDKLVIQATVNEPTPLAVADGKNGLSLAEVLGEATALALKGNERMTGELATSALSLEQAANEIAQLKTVGGEQAVRISEYERRIDQYNNEASSLRAQIALLMDQLAAVTKEAVTQ